MVLHALHLCSGYGGFELALGDAARTVAHVERDAYAAAVLVARMGEARLDQAPVWSDLCTFDTGPWVGRVDIITAGFPCQPFSAAGKRAGTDDDRWLWPDICRIIGEVRSRYVFLENVPGVVRHGLPHVLADLAGLGFDAELEKLSTRPGESPIAALSYGIGFGQMIGVLVALERRTGRRAAHSRPDGPGPHS